MDAITKTIQKLSAQTRQSLDLQSGNNKGRSAIYGDIRFPNGFQPHSHCARTQREGKLVKSMGVITSAVTGC